MSDAPRLAPKPGSKAAREQARRERRASRVCIEKKCKKRVSRRYERCLRHQVRHLRARNAELEAALAEHHTTEQVEQCRRMGCTRPRAWYYITGTIIRRRGAYCKLCNMSFYIGTNFARSRNDL